MKKNFFLLVILAMALVGCKDNAEVRSAAGTYSYKTSGTIQVDTLRKVTFTEIGAMEVVSLKDKDSVLITFNELLGDVYSTRGSIQGNEITLSPFTRTWAELLGNNPIVMQVSGQGQVYDGSIVMTLQYSGMTQDSLKISANNVQLIAKKNK